MVRRSPSSPTADRARMSSGSLPVRARLRASPRLGLGPLDRVTALRVLGSQPWSRDGRSLVFSRLEQDQSAALSRVELRQPARRLASPRRRRESSTSVRPGLPTTSGSRSTERRRARLEFSVRSGGRGRAGKGPLVDGRVRYRLRVGRSMAATSYSARYAVPAWISTIWSLADGRRAPADHWSKRRHRSSPPRIGSRSRAGPTRPIPIACVSTQPRD